MILLILNSASIEDGGLSKTKAFKFRITCKNSLFAANLETHKLQLAGTGGRVMISNSYNLHNARYPYSPLPARKNLLFAASQHIKNVSLSHKQREAL
jgi:hypothetical protein